MEIISTVVQQVVAISDSTQVGQARRAASNLAESIGWNERQIGKLSLIVTELSTNIVKHASSGELLLCPSESANGNTQIDVIAIDRGPGISDLSKSLEDGYSTAGSSGTGLGAIRRQADFFEVFSSSGSGTVLLARVASNQNGSANGGNGHHDHIIRPYVGDTLVVMLIYCFVKSFLDFPYLITALASTSPTCVSSHTWTCPRAC